MPEFKYAAPGGKKKHTHVVYVNDDGTGRSSPHADGSFHVIVLPAPAPTPVPTMPAPAPTPVPTMPAPTPAMPGMEQPEMGMEPPDGMEQPEARLSPGEDGHTHELTELPEYTSPTRIETEDEEEKISDVTQLYKDAQLYEEQSRKNGKESKEFLAGNQWPKEIKQALEEQNRACLVINHTEANHDILSGIFRDNRTDWKVLPIENGDSLTADILSIVMKQIASASDFAQEETRVFDDVQDVGRGFFEIYPDFDVDINGQIRLNHFPWDGVYCGPHDKLDGSDMEYIVKKKWFSYRKLKQLYPKKVDEIDRMANLTSDEIKSLREEPGAKFAISGIENLEDLDMSDLSAKKYAVLECERKVYRQVPLLIDEENAFVFDGSLLSPKDLADAKKIKQFRVISRNVHDIRVTSIAGSVLLDDFIADDRPSNDFSLIPVYCKKEGKNFWGKIEAIKDPQRELNKRRSQNTDIMDRCVIEGWFTDQNTFVNKQDEADFEENVARPGFHAKIQDVKAPPLKATANPYPTGVIQMEKMADDSVRRVSGVTLEMAGMEQSNSNSGVLFAAKQRQGMVGQKFMFDNFALAKKRLGKQIIAYIQEMYSADRIMRLLENLAQKDPTLQVAGTDLGQFQREQLKQVIQQALDNKELTKYDIEIAESPFSSTSRQANAMLLLEMARMYPTEVPPDVIIDAFDIPGKQKIIARIEQQRQQLAAQEQAKNQTEIQKTQIAANAKNQPNEPNQPNQPNQPATLPLQTTI